MSNGRWIAYDTARKRGEPPPICSYDKVPEQKVGGAFYCAIRFKRCAGTLNVISGEWDEFVIDGNAWELKNIQATIYPTENGHEAKAIVHLVANNIDWKGIPKKSRFYQHFEPKTRTWKK